MHNNKRRQNNGGNGNGQNRHNNNRPRRFGGGGGSRPQDDSMNVARARRNATQSREKYQNMARDAMSMGDRVQAENYLQHADHYYRVLMALPPEEVRQPYQQRSGNPSEDGMPMAADDAGQGHSGDSVPQETGQATPGALPAFITQPASHDHSQDNIHE